MKFLALPTLSIFILWGCGDAAQTSKAPIREGLFIEAESNCTLYPEKIFRRSRHPVEQIRTLDKRWVARTNPETSQHILELYDTFENRKYFLYHPNIEVMLMDLSFNNGSKYLSFIGSPWGVNGISEVFVFDLETQQIQRFGEEGRGYRYPRVLSEDMELLFYESQVRALGALSLSQLASHENIGYFLGFRNRDGEVLYMKKIPGGKRKPAEFKGSIAFLSYRESLRQLEEILPTLGILDGDRPNTYFGHSTIAYSPTGGYATADIIRLTIEVSGDQASVVDKRNVNRVETISRRMEQTELTELFIVTPEIEAFPMQSICLESAHIQ